MSREAAPGRAEQQLLAAPRLDALVTAVVIAITAGVFAAVAGHAMLIRIQRLDDAWLRLMVSGRSAPLTATAKALQPPWAGLRHAARADRHRGPAGPAASLVASGRLRRGRGDVGGIDRPAERDLRPGQAARVTRRHKRCILSVRAFGRSVGHRHGRGHRPGSRRKTAQMVVLGRGGLLDPDGAVPRLPRRPLAVRCVSRDPARDVVRPGCRLGNRPVPAPAARQAAEAAGWNPRPGCPARAGSRARTSASGHGQSGYGHETAIGRLGGDTARTWRRGMTARRLAGSAAGHRRCRARREIIKSRRNPR